MRLCHWAIGLCVVAALLISIVVIILFIADLAAINFAIPVSLLFIDAMDSMTLGLLLFLSEVTIATRSVRVEVKVIARLKARRCPRRPNPVFSRQSYNTPRWRPCRRAERELSEDGA